LNFFWWQKKQNHFFFNKKKQKLILALESFTPLHRERLAQNAARKACYGFVHLSRQSWKLLVIYTLQEEKFKGFRVFQPLV
jgi:hypothetical protein